MRRSLLWGPVLLLAPAVCISVNDSPAAAKPKISVTGVLEGKCATTGTVNLYSSLEAHSCSYFMIVTPGTAKVRLFTYEKSKETGNQWRQSRIVGGEMIPQWEFNGTSARLADGVLGGELVSDHWSNGRKDVYFKGERKFQKRFKITNSFGKTIFDSGPISLTVNYPGRVNSQWVIPEGTRASTGYHGSKSCREDFFSGRLKPGESTALPAIAAQVPFAPPPPNATVNGQICSPGPSAPLLQNPVLTSAEISSVRRIRASLDAAGEMVNPGLISSLGVAGEGESATASDASLWALIVASGCPGNRAGCPDFIAMSTSQVLRTVTGIRLEWWCRNLEELLVLRTTSCPDTLHAVTGWTFPEHELRMADVVVGCQQELAGRNRAAEIKARCERLMTTTSLDEVFWTLVDPFDIHLSTLESDARTVRTRAFGPVSLFCRNIREGRLLWNSGPATKIPLSDERANCQGVLPAAG